MQKKKPQDAAWKMTVRATRPANSLHSVLVLGKSRQDGPRFMLLLYRGSSLYVCCLCCIVDAAAAET